MSLDPLDITSFESKSRVICGFGAAGVCSHILMPTHGIRGLLRISLSFFDKTFLAVPSVPSECVLMKL